MKKFIIIPLLIFPGLIFGQKSKIKLKTETDSVSYALGISLGHSLTESKLKAVSPDILAAGIKDVLNASAKPLLGDSLSNVLIRAYISKMYAQEAKANLEQSNKFLQENAKKEGVKTLPSGLQYIVMKEGTGEAPSINDDVTTHYTGMTVDGKVFDSSVERGQPVTFPLNGVIKGWTEALQLMKVGSKWKLFIPPDLAYGENPPPGSNIKPNEVLIFEVELLSISKGQTENQDNDNSNMNTNTDENQQQ